MIAHQTQPTRTTCGTTCVAMIVNVPARQLMPFQKMHIQNEKRKLRTSYSTNVAELVRMLRAYGFDVDRRMEFDDAAVLMRAGDMRDFGLLRVHRRTVNGNVRANWHWCLLADGFVYDPAAHTRMEARIFFDETKDFKIYFYAVTKES